MLTKMKIHNNNYSVEFIPEGKKIVFQGNLRLQSIDKYNEIIDFIFTHYNDSEELITLDLTQLSVLNSSGIASLGMFLIRSRETNRKIKILASKYVYWQSLTIEDFKEIHRNLEIEYVVHH